MEQAQAFAEPGGFGRFRVGGNPRYTGFVRPKALNRSEEFIPSDWRREGPASCVVDDVLLLLFLLILPYVYRTAPRSGREHVDYVYAVPENRLPTAIWFAIIRGAALRRIYFGGHVAMLGGTQIVPELVFISPILNQSIKTSRGPLLLVGLCRPNHTVRLNAS